MTWYQGPEGSGAPLGRWGHTSTLIKDNRVFVFGGRNNDVFFNDLHILDLELMAWSTPQTTGPVPSARSNHVSLLIG